MSHTRKLLWLLFLSHFCGLILRTLSHNILSTEIVLTCCRILVQHMERFQGEAKAVNWHIKSKFTEEMSMPSHVVSISS